MSAKSDIFAACKYRFMMYIVMVDLPTKFLAPPLLAASVSYSPSRCCQTFSDFSDSREPLHTQSICQYAQKCGSDFLNFDSKMFVTFF